MHAWLERQSLAFFNKITLVSNMVSTWRAFQPVFDFRPTFVCFTFLCLSTVLHNSLFCFCAWCFAIDKYKIMYNHLAFERIECFTQRSLCTILWIRAWKTKQINHVFVRPTSQCLFSFQLYLYRFFGNNDLGRNIGKWQLPSFWEQSCISPSASSNFSKYLDWNYVKNCHIPVPIWLHGELPEK